MYVQMHLGLASRLAICLVDREALGQERLIHRLGHPRGGLEHGRGQSRVDPVDVFDMRLRGDEYMAGIDAADVHER